MLHCGPCLLDVVDSRLFWNSSSSHHSDKKTNHSFLCGLAKHAPAFCSNINTASIPTEALERLCCSHSPGEVERHQVRERQRGNGNQAHPMPRSLPTAPCRGVSKRGVGREGWDTQEGWNTFASVLPEWTRKAVKRRGHENVPEKETQRQATPRSLQLLIPSLQACDSF